MHLGKDYFLEGTTLIKKNLIERKHLLWKDDGIPCIDAILWDKYVHRIKDIEFHTDKGRIFRVKAFVFDRSREKFNLGYGTQYKIAKEYWKIEQKKKEGKKSNPVFFGGEHNINDYPKMQERLKEENKKNKKGKKQYDK